VRPFRERSIVETREGIDSVDLRRGPVRCRASSLASALAYGFAAVLVIAGSACTELTTKEPVNGAKPPPPASSAPRATSRPAAATASPAPPFESSMKGWELYGWMDGNDVRFVLTIGTNFQKACADVKDAPPGVPGPPRHQASGMAEVKALLARVPAKDTIIWQGNPCGLDTPPPEIVAELRRFVGNERFTSKP
jgi:hypothetical protein